MHVPPDGRPAERRYVAYYRVSTKTQGRSGLGLEGQRIAVLRFVEQHRPCHLVAEFTEVESGRKTDLDRPQLAAAISIARRKRATLVIARLDRLARNVALVARLMESHVDFVAADMPGADRLTLHIVAAVAEHEANLIAARRREATDAMLAQGRKLGSAAKSPEERAALSAIGNAALAASRAEHARQTMPHILELRRKGIAGYKAAAAALTAAGIPTFTGKGPWYGDSVKAIVKAIEPGFQVQRPRMDDWHKRKLIAATVHANIAAADARAAALAPVIAEIEGKGITTHIGIARELTRRGIPTARGRTKWGCYAVQLLQQRLAEQRAARSNGPKSSGWG